MENIIQGNIFRSAAEVVEPISQRADDSSLPWGHDHPMAAFIDTYACIGLGGLDFPARGKERCQR